MANDISQARATDTGDHVIVDYNAHVNPNHKSSRDNQYRDALQKISPDRRLLENKIYAHHK